MTEDLDETSKEWISRLADKEFVRVYVNISLGSLEINCPAGRVEKEGKIMYDRAMEFIEKYNELYGAIGEDDINEDDKEGYQ